MRDAVIIHTNINTHTRARIDHEREEIAVEEAEKGRWYGHETRICVVILWK